MVKTSLMASMEMSFGNVDDDDDGQHMLTYGIHNRDVVENAKNSNDHRILHSVQDIKEAHKP